MADLSTLTSRRRLPRDGGKRWTRLATGRALGYRRSSSEAGTWYVRVHTGGSAYRMASLGVADDVLEADGEEVLSYRQALTLASRWEADRQETICLYFSLSLDVNVLGLFRKDAGGLFSGGTPIGDNQ